MAKSKSKDLDAVLHGHILAIIGVLNVFLDEELVLQYYASYL